MSYYGGQTQNGAGKAIFNNLRPLAAVRYLEDTKQKTIIYPLRKEKPAPLPNSGMVFRIQPSKGDLFFDPVNHDKGSPKCTISMQDFELSQNGQGGICKICQREFPINSWYYDVTLAMIIMQYKNNPNKRDIVECVKFYDDGEYEILYTEYQEAVDTDQYLVNDPIIDELIKVQKEVVDRIGNNQNVILEQSPDLIENFTKIIDEALQQ